MKLSEESVPRATYWARNPFFIAALLLGALFVFSFFAPPAYGETAAEIQTKIDEQNAKIADLEKEIAEYEKQLTTIGNQKNTLQNTINQLDISRKKINADISVTQTRINETTLQLSQLSGQIGDKESHLALDKNAIKKAFQTTYQIGDSTLVEHLLASGGFAEAWERVDNLERLHIALREQMEELLTTKEALTVDLNATQKKQNELKTLKVKLVEQQGSLNAAKKAQTDLLAETKSRESTYQNLLAEKQAEKDTFESALFELASQLQYTLDPSSVPSAGKGVLRWPLDKVFVTQQFGKTSSSGRLYTSGTHDGIDLRASVGTLVRASLSGTVLEINNGAVPYCQYGKWVMIKHSNGLATLYAHLTQINVEKGQVVGTGQVIGYSGDTGYATGPHLHFTVYAADAVSFKQYKCKSGRSVTIPIAPKEAYLNPMSYL